MEQVGIGAVLPAELRVLGPAGGDPALGDAVTVGVPQEA